MPRPLPNPSAKRSRAGSKRRAAGWMLLTLGVLVAGVLVWSGWRTIRYAVPNGETGVKKGVIYTSTFETYPVGGEKYLGWFVEESPVGGFHWFDPRTRFPPECTHVGVGLAWYEEWDFTKEDDRSIYFGIGLRHYYYAVLWPLPLLLWTTGGHALWSGRRARRRALEGHCPTCGYNLAGLNRDAGVGVCPECGKAKAV